MLPLPISEGWIWENMLDFRLLDLIAELIVACEPPPKRGPGHPRSALVRVIATLRRFLREGLPWRSLRATIEQVSGSTLRRFLAYWAENAVLAKVHALLVAMLRGNPTLILDGCSVRAKRGGDLVGPNPTDRAKMGSNVSHRHQWRWRAGGLAGHRRQRAGHAPLRAAVPCRLGRHGAHSHGLCRQRL